MNRALEPLNSVPIYHIRPDIRYKGWFGWWFQGSRGRPCGAPEPRSGTPELGPDIPYPTSDIRYKRSFGGWFQSSLNRPCGAPEPRSGAPEIGPDIPYSTSDIRYKRWFGGWFQGSLNRPCGATRALEPQKSVPIYHIRPPISDIKGCLKGGFKGSRNRPISRPILRLTFDMYRLILITRCVSCLVVSYLALFGGILLRFPLLC
jgi:hypothetical protein